MLLCVKKLESVLNISKGSNKKGNKNQVVLQITSMLTDIEDTDIMKLYGVSGETNRNRGVISRV